MPRPAPGVPAVPWTWLRRWMRAASLASILLVALVVGFIPFFAPLWGHWIEAVWALAVGALSCFLLVAQYQLAGFTCPRCGGHWIAGPWALANPLMLWRSRCHHCGMEVGETP